MRDIWERIDRRYGVWCSLCDKVIRFGPRKFFTMGFVADEKCLWCGSNKTYWDSWIHPRGTLFVFNERRSR